MISIIIPVYNVEQYLKKCIDSILRQSYTDYEVILIDDGSTDSSGEICDSYQTNKHFKVFHQNNLGVSMARNKGLDNAAGEYILFVDPDDWIADNALEILMQKVGDADLVMFNYFKVFGTNEQRMSFLNVILSKNNHKQDENCDPYYEILGKTGMIGNKFFKHSTIGNIRFHKNMSLGEDMVFIAESLHNVKVAKVIPDLLYYYLLNREGNVVSAPIDTRLLEFLNNSKEVFKICSRENYPTVGIQILSSSVNYVLTKIPLDLHKIKNNREYIIECKSSIMIPSFFCYLRYFMDRKISFKAKRVTVFAFLGRIYLYLRLLKHAVIE